MKLNRSGDACFFEESNNYRINLSPVSKTPNSKELVENNNVFSCLDSVKNPSFQKLTEVGVNIDLSLCGSCFEAFEQNRITYDQFLSDPGLLYDSKLTLRVDGQFISGRVGLPLLYSYLVFRKPITRASLPAIQSHQITVTKEASEINSNLYSSVDLNEFSDVDNLVGGSSLAGNNVSSDKNPSSDLLKSLGLRYGINSATFTVTSRLHGSQSVNCNIFLWTNDVKIIISDIDGTITKSDVLGNVAGFLGADYTHTGIAKLFSNVSSCNYQFLYVTSRAIGQADYTREYIRNIHQGSDPSLKLVSDLSLPLGPMIMCCDFLVDAFKREVIHRKPQEFKISALTEVKRLFPPNFNPYFAGFGNRETDVVSYQAVDIPFAKIFIINPDSNILHDGKNYQGYEELNEFVTELFPRR